MAGVAAGLMVAAGIGAAFVRLPYDTIEPGLAREVEDLVTISGHPVYPPEGGVLFATVASRSGINPYQAIAGWLDKSIDVVRQEVVRGDLNPDEYRRLNVVAMADSKTTAEIVALHELGFTDLGVGAEIVDVAPELPAAAVLQAGDLVVAVDGAEVASAEDAVRGIQARGAGDRIDIRFVRDGDRRDGRVTLARGDDGGPLLGVRLTTKIALPFDVTIDSGNIVGPSAGLAYALELLDLLTPGELTGGAQVAATGELARDGTVRPVGGVAQKAVAVRRAGAVAFIVPKANEAEARSLVGDSLKIIGVNDFAEALAALAEMPGSNALALVPSPAAA